MLKLSAVGTLIDTFLYRNVQGANVWPFDRHIPEVQANILRQKFEIFMKWKTED
jgi:hypothetical protein